MAQLIRKYMEDLDKLESVIEENADNLLGAIDLDELLKDPEGYLLSLGDAFLKEHIDEIEKAGQLGTKFANKIIKES